VVSHTASGNKVLMIFERDERNGALSEVVLQGTADVVRRGCLLEVDILGCMCTRERENRGKF
jgi:hypothetical protein